MQNFLGILAVTVLCAVFMLVPSLFTYGKIPAPFQLQAGAFMRLLDLDDTDHVKICIDAANKSSGVLVTYDGKEGQVDPGDCISVEAKTVAVRTIDALPRGTVVTGMYSIDQR